MGMDDEECGDSASGVHRFALSELSPAGAGIALVSVCEFCGAVAYEASAADDPRRET